MTADLYYVRKVECIACGHVEMLTAMMLSSAGVKPYETILDLERKLRCRECDARGKAVVSITWGEPAAD